MAKLTKLDYDKLFCSYGKKYGIKKLILKAVAVCESALDERAYRFEPGFWDKYLKNNPEWNKRDPAEVSASYGLMQLMYPTATNLGFSGSGEDLYNPVYNIELGAKLLRRNLNRIYDLGLHMNTQNLPIEIALARYNGGTWKNPDKNGELRNIKYVKKVMRKWFELHKLEKECDD